MSRYDKLKKGDKIKLVGNGWSPHNLDEIKTISYIEDSGVGSVYVKFDSRLPMWELSEYLDDHGFYVEFMLESKKEFRYEDSGVVVNGEILYKRVEV